MVVNQLECSECTHAGSAETAAFAAGAKASVGSDGVLVAALILFAVAALFIFSAGRS